MKSLFVGFDDADDIADEFSGRSWGLGGDTVYPKPDLSNTEIAVAVYDGNGYSMNTFILFRNTEDGAWYEVNGSHCSCYGLEGQWEPELVDPKAILIREKFVWTFGGDETLNDQIKSIVRELFA